MTKYIYVCIYIKIILIFSIGFIWNCLYLFIVVVIVLESFFVAVLNYNMTTLYLLEFVCQLFIYFFFKNLLEWPLWQSTWNVEMLSFFWVFLNSKFYTRKNKYNLIWNNFVLRVSLLFFNWDVKNLTMFQINTH